MAWHTVNIPHIISGEKQKISTKRETFVAFRIK